MTYFFMGQFLDMYRFDKVTGTQCEMTNLGIEQSRDIHHKVLLFWAVIFHNDFFVF